VRSTLIIISWLLALGAVVVWLFVTGWPNYVTPMLLGAIFLRLVLFQTE